MILLTGGAGYVGSACLRYLLKRGHDALPSTTCRKGIEMPCRPGRLIVGDICDAGSLDSAIDSLGVNAVMHFAAVASVPESIADPERYWRVNVIGTKNVLDAMKRHGIDKLVFSSTAATYGFHAEMPLTEDSPQHPETPYGTTKLACEWMIREYTAAPTASALPCCATSTPAAQTRTVSTASIDAAKVI